jgi:hypothetical protein
MNLDRRLEKLEQACGANVCPCRTPKLIQIMETNDSTENVMEWAGCGQCGEALPISQIVVLNPLKGAA